MSQIAPKCMICITASNMQIRCQKGAGTKMHKCLVGKEIFKIQVDEIIMHYVADCL